MKAVILVGGFGTRLRPLTLSVPKQMLPMGSVTMLQRVVEHLGGLGVEEVVLSLGYQPEVFLREFPDGEIAGVPVRYAVEPEPLDTGGAIAFAAREAGIDDTFLALNGDVLTDLDVGELWRFHQKAGGAATIALTKVDDPSRYGVVPLAGDGRVEAFIEKPEPGTAPTDWINAGTYVLEPSVLDRIPDGRKVSIERETFPAMVGEGTLFALHSDAYWVDAGTPATYLQVQLDLIDGVRNTESAIAPTATVAADAVIDNSVVLAGARVDAGAVVRDALVMHDAVVGAGAQVVGSIVGPESVVGAGAKVLDLSVIGTAQTIDAGAELRGARVPAPD